MLLYYCYYDSYFFFMNDDFIHDLIKRYKSKVPSQSCGTMLGGFSFMYIGTHDVYLIFICFKEMHTSTNIASSTVNDFMHCLSPVAR